MAKDVKTIIFKINPELLDKIDDFRFKNRFENRSDAIKWLINWSLKLKPKIERGPHGEMVWSWFSEKYSVRELKKLVSNYKQEASLLESFLKRLESSEDSSGETS
jgi:Arc/MetJ-type ribon-helix-helix transcriptional regulator